MLVEIDWEANSWFQYMYVIHVIQEAAAQVLANQLVANYLNS